MRLAAFGTHSLRQPVSGGFAESAVEQSSPACEASAAGATWVLLSSQPSNPAVMLAIPVPMAVIA
jgi:hypothetical protein